MHCYTPVKETVSRRRSRHISLGYILINVQAQVCEFFKIWGSKFLKIKKKFKKLNLEHYKNDFFAY